MLLLGSKHFDIKRSSSVTYVVDLLFHHLKVAYSAVYMSHHIFVLLNQNSDSAGHMTFEKEKIICSPVRLTY